MCALSCECCKVGFVRQHDCQLDEKEANKETHKQSNTKQMNSQQRNIKKFEPEQEDLVGSMFSN